MLTNSAATLLSNLRAFNIRVYWVGGNLDQGGRCCFDERETKIPKHLLLEIARIPNELRTLVHDEHFAREANKPT